MPSMNQISPKEPVDLSIYGMTCAACVRRVETALAAVPGVGSASVNLANRRARVSGDAPVDALLEAVDAVGYRAAPAPKDLAEEAAEDRAQAAEFRGELIKLTAAALLTLPLILQMGAELLGLSWMLPGWVQALLAAPVQFWAGARFYKAAWRAARSGHGNMDLLVVLGTSAAFFFSLYQLLLGMPHLYFEAAAVVVTLVLLGRVLEARARRSAVGGDPRLDEAPSRDGPHRARRAGGRDAGRGAAPRRYPDRQARRALPWGWRGAGRRERGR